MIVTCGQCPLYGVVSQIENSRAPSCSIIGWYTPVNFSVNRSLRSEPSATVSCRYNKVWLKYFFTGQSSIRASAAAGHWVTACCIRAQSSCGRASPWMRTLPSSSTSKNILGDRLADSVPGALGQVHFDTHTPPPHAHRTNAGSRLIPCTKLLNR